MNEEKDILQIRKDKLSVSVMLSIRTHNEKHPFLVDLLASSTGGKLIEKITQSSAESELDELEIKVNDFFNDRDIDI